MLQIVLKAFQEVSFRLLCGEAGDLFERFLLGELLLFQFGLHLVGFFDLSVECLFLFLRVVDLAVKGLLFLLDAFFVFAQVLSLFLDLPFRLVAVFQDLFLRFDHRFPLLRLRRFDGVVQNTGRFFFRAADFPFGDSFSKAYTNEEKYNSRNNGRKDRKQNEKRLL